MRLALCATIIASLLLACTTAHKSDESRPAMRTILVTGATGTQGGAVARALLQRGYSVRALTRSPDKPAAQALVALGATLAKGDFADVDSLVAAMDGADGVFAMTDFWRHSYQVEVQHGRNLVDAAKRAKVGHFVFTSVASADRATGIPHFDSKSEIETYLRASGLPYSIVRPVSFMENWAYIADELRQGRYTSPLSPDTVSQYIAARDIGYFVAEAFDHPSEWFGQAVDIAGDELTGAALVELLADAWGHPISYQQIPWPDYLATAGEEMTVMEQWFETTGYDVDIAALRAQHPSLLDTRSFIEAASWIEAE